MKNIKIGKNLNYCDAECKYLLNNIYCDFFEEYLDVDYNSCIFYRCEQCLALFQK